MAGTCIIPVDILRDDPYFSKEKHVFSRAEALAWIAANVRYVDNCVLKKWQETWSIRHLSEVWAWTLKRVRCFLKACEKRGLIRASVGHIKGTAQLVITYLVQRLDWGQNSSGAQVGAKQGHSKGLHKEGGKEEREEDSPVSPQGDAPAEDPFDPSRWQTVGDDGAGSSEPAHGAGDAKSDNVASDDAGSPPNSAAPPSRKPRQSREKPDIDAWVPSQELIDQMAAETGASRDVIDWNVRKMRDWCRVTTKPVKDLNARFRNWMRSWKEDQDERAKRQSQFKTVKEKEFCI